MVSSIFVTELSWLGRKFDDSGLENYERGGDFYFGVEAPRLGRPAINYPGASPGGVGGASFLLFGTSYSYCLE